MMLICSEPSAAQKIMYIFLRKKPHSGKPSYVILVVIFVDINENHEHGKQRPVTILTHETLKTQK